MPTESIAADKIRLKQQFWYTKKCRGADAQKKMKIIESDFFVVFLSDTATLNATVSGQNFVTLSFRTNIFILFVLFKGHLQLGLI